MKTGFDFHETQMGHKFFVHDVPKAIKSIDRLADALETNNQLLKDNKKSSEQEVCKGYLVFRDILADNLSVEGLLTYVNDVNDEAIHESLRQVIAELVVGGCVCPNCAKPLFYSDQPNWDYYCPECSRYFKMGDYKVPKEGINNG